MLLKSKFLFISFHNELGFFNGIIFCTVYIPGVNQPVTKYSIFKQLPDLKDAEAVQKFFLEEIQLGEELLAQGN